MLTASARKHSAHSAIDRAVRAALASKDGRHPRIASSFHRLLRHVRRRSALLRSTRAEARIDAAELSRIVEGLLALASHDLIWIREPEAWEPDVGNPYPQFSSLASHLLAAYTVPTFMTSVWFKGQDAGARRQQGWFAHMGQGRNIRTAELPLPLTKRMAHHFLLAPDHLTVEQALRWGQTRGLGGSKPLALAVAASRLGQSFGAEEFWGTVVQFFANHPDLDVTQVALIVDYLHHQKFVADEVLVDEGAFLGMGPAQPNLSMKGRTPRSLLRLVREWRAGLTAPKQRVGVDWQPSGIGGLRYVEREAAEGLRCWTIRELVCGEALRQEGAAMRHCVASYAGACARRQTSIWSLRFEDGERRFRVMTIEVNPITRTIRQARRHRNAPPNAKALGITKLWAEREGLRLAL